MNFNSHSLQRLRELGRNLPKPLPKPNKETQIEHNKTQTIHPVETENNPEELFKQLLEISPDGNIPSHLIDRLKQAELNNSRQSIDNRENKEKTSNYNKQNSQKKSKRSKDFLNKSNTIPDKCKDEESLYINFKQLLLEDED